MISSKEKNDACSRNTRWGITLLYSFALVWYFAPESYALSASNLAMWNIMITLVSLCAVSCFLIKVRISAQWLAFTGFIVSAYIISSLSAASGRGITSILLYAFKEIGFASLVNIGVVRNKREFLLGFIIAGAVMCGVNYQSFIEYADVLGGMKNGQFSYLGTRTAQHYFFLSIDNGTVFYYIPLLTAMGYYAKYYNSRMMSSIHVITCAASLYMYAYLESATAIIALLCYTILSTICLFSNGTRRFQMLRNTIKNYRLVVLLGLAINAVAILFTSFGPLQQISSYFGKGTNISGRTILWSNVLRSSSQSPFFGLGFNTPRMDIIRIGIDHAHNIILQVLYQGGMLSLLLFLAFVIAIHIAETHAIAIHEDDIISLGAFTILLAGTMDFYMHYTPQYFPFLLYGALYSKELTRRPEQKNNSKSLYKRGFYSSFE